MATDYADGRWVPGVGAKASFPVARVTRKRAGKRGDEILRCAHHHATAAEARSCAKAWAGELNERAS